MSINKAMLLGRLGQDPELKYTPAGAAVCNFSVATSESWNDKNGQKQERTEWHRVVVWGKLGELCNQYLAKGREVFIEGKIATRSWDAEDGTKRYATEVIASNVQFIGANANANANAVQNKQAQAAGPAPQAGQPANNYQQQMPPQPEGNFTADDIPF